MSCFTIAKEDYMKAAGIIAGMAKEAEVWLYNADAHRNMDKTDYKAKFTECYKMNAESVMERFHSFYVLRYIKPKMKKSMKSVRNFMIK